MARLTIKSLLEAQGVIFAEALHNRRAPNERAGCYAAWRDQYKLVTDGLMSHEQFCIMERTFRKRLDELEPMLITREAAK